MSAAKVWHRPVGGDAAAALPSKRSPASAFSSETAHEGDGTATGRLSDNPYGSMQTITLPSTRQEAPGVVVKAPPDGTVWHPPGGEVVLAVTPESSPKRRLSRPSNRATAASRPRSTSGGKPAPVWHRPTSTDAPEPVIPSVQRHPQWGSSSRAGSDVSDAHGDGAGAGAGAGAEPDSGGSSWAGHSSRAPPTGGPPPRLGAPPGIVVLSGPHSGSGTPLMNPPPFPGAVESSPTAAGSSIHAAGHHPGKRSLRVETHGASSGSMVPTSLASTTSNRSSLYSMSTVTRSPTVFDAATLGLVEGQTLRRCVHKGWLLKKSSSSWRSKWQPRYFRVIVHTRVARVLCASPAAVNRPPQEGLEEIVESAWLAYYDTDGPPVDARATVQLQSMVASPSTDTRVLRKYPNALQVAHARRRTYHLRPPEPDEALPKKHTSVYWIKAINTAIDTCGKPFTSKFRRALPTLPSSSAM